MIVIWLWRIRDQGQAVLAAGLALVLGGAIGNLMDRLIYGSIEMDRINGNETR